MKTLETDRLILRKYEPEDLASVSSFESVPENLVYMTWGPNTKEQSLAFIKMAILKAAEEPCVNYYFVAVLKDTGKIIGSCSLIILGNEGEIGWLLHLDYWNKGLGTEMGRALLELGFDELNLHRILSHCDTENIGSYRIMEKLGMRREGVFLEGRPGNKNTDEKYSDEFAYGLTKGEWDAGKEIAYYNSLPCVFEGFIDLPELSDGTIYLVCTDMKPAIPEKNYVPSYDFAICKGSEKIGAISLRIGYKGFGPDLSSLYYGGQIGYGVDEKHRGNGYAVRACRLLLPVAKAHGMKKLLITNIHTNTASRRVCEKLGARFVRRARLPEWIDLYKDGGRFVNIFELEVE